MGLLAQMIADPASSIKLVTDLPFGHVLPIPSTPYANASGTGAVQAQAQAQAQVHGGAGYSGPGECLRHVYNAPWMKAGVAKESSWVAFDQGEFSDPNGDGEVGFQPQGWVYIPERCRAGTGNQVCKLVVRPDTCSPPSSFAPDVAEFANYAEVNAIVVLHPCTGGAVDKRSAPVPRAYVPMCLCAYDYAAPVSRRLGGGGNAALHRTRPHSHTRTHILLQQQLLLLLLPRQQLPPCSLRRVSS